MVLPEIPNQSEERKDPLKDPLIYKILEIIGVRGAALLAEDLPDYVKEIAAGTGLSPEDIMKEIKLVREEKGM